MRLTLSTGGSLPQLRPPRPLSQLRVPQLIPEPSTSLPPAAAADPPVRSQGGRPEGTPARGRAGPGEALEPGSGAAARLPRRGGRRGGGGAGGAPGGAERDGRPGAACRQGAGAVAAAGIPSVSAGGGTRCRGGRPSMSEKKQPVDLGLLEEDDEFEEFPAEGAGRGGDGTGGEARRRGRGGRRRRRRLRL